MVVRRSYGHGLVRLYSLYLFHSKLIPPSLAAISLGVAVKICITNPALGDVSRTVSIGSRADLPGGRYIDHCLGM